MRPFLLIPAMLSVVLAACTTEPIDPAYGPWVGTITTEGNVTTVANESGSAWGGTATLVEEASIGVDAGADEYMFGSVDALYLTENHVYVVEVDVEGAVTIDCNHLAVFWKPDDRARGVREGRGGRRSGHLSERRPGNPTGTYSYRE